MHTTGYVCCILQTNYQLRYDIYLFLVISYQTLLFMSNISNQISSPFLMQFASLVKNPEFKKRFHGLVWNSRISKQQFEDGWNLILKEFNLEKDEWMTGIYNIRDSWIPAFFRDVPMAGLMRTTSLTESQNWSFCNTIQTASQLINLMDTFDTAMEKQRHNQSLNDYKTATTFPKTLTYLPYEPHAAKVYTRRVFYQIQEEIFQSDKSCFQKSVFSEAGIDTFVVLEKSKKITTRKEKNVDVDGEVEEYHYDTLLFDTEFTICIPLCVDVIFFCILSLITL